MSASASSAAFVGEAQANAASRVGGRYVLLDRLGSGGMGVVYRARDEASGRVVALKQLLSARAGSKRRTVEALFEREYHTLLRLKHPRIIEVYDYGFTETGPYYTMELLEGNDLSQLGRLPYREACRHARDVASSLALIHAQRIIHRDVSLRNIRFGGDGRAKLIDFGALLPFGTSPELIGTPLCIAPEAFYCKPLDQRTDLYALGAILYWLLTGRHAYPARRMAELSQAWQTPPLPPSALAPGIPSTLEQLVLSLLSLDPLGRPPSAAAVIDELTAIAGLEPEEYEHAAQSYLASGRLVGRELEIDGIAPRIQAAVEGRGGQVLLDGPAGVGKTRLLHELVIEAQLKGAVALKADAEANPQPFGVAVALALGLLDACPELARQAAAPHSAVLVHLSPALRERLGEVEAQALPQDLGQRRGLFQTALREWFLRVAAERALVLGVDNVQTADDNSLAWLATLARKARTTQLLVIATKRSGEAVVARAPFRLMQQYGTRLKLAGLNVNQCEELVRSLFGEVANTGRLARIFFDKSAGLPQGCIDLAQLLVRKRIARYAGGTWVLPLDFSPDELPSEFGEIVASRLSSLSPLATDMLEALSIHAKPVPIERCVSVLEGQNESEMFAVLDALVAEQLLLSEAGSYRFAQESLRRAVLGRMDEAQRRARHLRAAEMLLEGAGASSEARMEAALHFLDAGEVTKSARILSDVGWEFISDTGAHVSADPIAKALYRVLSVYQRQERSDHELAALLFPLMPLSYFSAHWGYLLEHGERALTIGLRITGLTFAQKLRRFVGRRLALVIGLLVGAIWFALKGDKKRLGYGLKQAIVASCAIVPSVVGTHTVSLDHKGVTRLAAIVEPLSLFGEGHIATLMYEFAAGQLLSSTGREREAMKLADHLRSSFQKPEIVAAIGEEHVKAIYGGILFWRGLIACYTTTDQALKIAAEMDALGIAHWSMGADQLRVLYHAFRGESLEVERYRERVELFAVQGGSTWQVELFWPSVLVQSALLAGDSLGIRQGWEQLARRAKEVKTAQGSADSAHAAFMMMRGELSAAIPMYERVCAQYPIRGRVGWQTMRGPSSDCLNRSGRHARAREVALEVVTNMEPGDEPLLGYYLQAQRQLALAEAGLGNTTEALRIVDGLLAKHGTADAPLLIGLIHKTKAEIALILRDGVQFETSFAEMSSRFRPTKNPALIAQCERLLAAAAQAGVVELGDALTSTEPSDTRERPVEASTTALVRDIGGAFDQVGRALKVVIEESRSEKGFVYFHRDRELKLVASSTRGEAPLQLEQALRVQLEQANSQLGRGDRDQAPEPSHSAVIRSTRPPARSRTSAAAVEIDPFAETECEGDQGEDMESTVLFDSPQAAEERRSYQLYVLKAPLAGLWLPIGGLILEADPDSFIQPRASVLAVLAQTVSDHEQAITAMSQVVSG